MNNSKTLAMASALVALTAPTMQTNYMFEMSHRDDYDDEPPKPKKHREYKPRTGAWEGDGVESEVETRQMRRKRERMERKAQATVDAEGGG